MGLRFEMINIEDKAYLFHGDCVDVLKGISDSSIQLVITSPPYNLGKSYESKIGMDQYISKQKEIIKECVRVLTDSGSICWQVGNNVKNGSIIPLDCILYPIFIDLGLKLRNRIIWHFGHGLHCKKRLSGRYEIILWWTKSDEYYFNLDTIRVPQKYPNKKYFKGPKKGKLSCNPLGKNPSDVWEIPNVKHNHVEKANHPCQFPVELAERCILSMTKEWDQVLDPFMGSGTSLVAAVMHYRKGIGCDIIKEYVELSEKRLRLSINGKLKVREIGKPIYNM